MNITKVGGRVHSVLAVVCSLGLMLVSSPGHGQSTNWPGDRWPTANSPSVMAMDTVQLQAAETYSKQPNANFGAGFVTRGGVLVYSWHDSSDPSSLYEVKSVTQSLIGASVLGLAMDDGKIALSDFAQARMAGFGVPTAANAATGWLVAITIEQLATQSAGFGGGHGFCDLIFQPGNEWSDSLCGVNWLGDVLTTQFKQDLYVVATDRLFTPLGIDPSMLIWRNPRYRLPGRLPVDPGVSVSRRYLSSGISATPDALARFGLLYLREGAWRVKGTGSDQQILSKSFVQQVGMPRASISSLPLPVRNPEQYFNASSHYGLLWWNNGDGRLAGVPTDAYWAWGYQRDSLVIVIPSLDLVVVRTGGTWRQSLCPTDRSGLFCPDYGVLDEFILPIVASVDTGVTLTNAAPVVNAGLDGVADLATGGSIALTGSATDDGQPGPLSYAWSVVSGPAPAPMIFPPTSANTNVTFGAVGTYVLELSANDGAITAYDRVVVRVKNGLLAVPTVTISASPPVIAFGTTTTLTWSSTDADSCEASGAWTVTGSKPTSGWEVTAELTVDSTFSLACTGPGGTSPVQSVTVEVEAPPLPTDVNLTAQPATITTGSSATLTWTTTEAESCTASGGWSGSKSATGGSETVTPTTTTSYTLRCVGTTEDTATATVTVSAPPPPPPPPPPGGGGGGAVDWWLMAGLLALGARRRSRHPELARG